MVRTFLTGCKGPRLKKRLNNGLYRPCYEYSDEIAIRIMFIEDSTVYLINTIHISLRLGTILKISNILERKPDIYILKNT